MIFALAAVLTATMLGWQSYHLYRAYQHAARQESGSCATKLTEAVYIGGQRQMDLLRDLEHELVVFGPAFDASAQAVWRAEYERSDRQFVDGLGAAMTATSGELRLAINATRDTYLRVRDDVETVFDGLEVGAVGEAIALVTSGGYQSRRVALRSALGEVVTALDAFISARAEEDRHGELVSVIGAILLFVLALGAWVFFLRRLRESDDRVESEAAHRREAERELQQAQKMEALGVMAGGIAHDVGNLNSIISGSAASARSHLDDRIHLENALGRIEAAAQDAGGLVDDLLTFAKRAPSDRRPLDLGRLIADSEDLIRAAAPGAVTATIETVEGVWIEGDPAQLRQALLNLVVNAGASMPDGGALTVRMVDPSERTAHVAVVDTGCGMSPDVLAHVFEPFFSARPTGGQGTGLGLSIVHGIVSEHRGSIAIDSVEGAGTTVRVSFPRVAIPRSPPPTTPSHLPGTVLIVAPSGYVTDLMSEELARHGNTVLHAREVSEATVVWEDTSVDLMLVDHTLGRVLQAPGRPVVPTIYTTGTNTMGPPGVTVIREPFTLNELSRVATELLTDCQESRL